MKIRSIELVNFRKFVGTVRVAGIGDGVNVLVGRNELGKSTLLAAVNGAIFEKANSTGKEVRGFRHIVNGTVPEVKLAFDLEGRIWTIHKRFAGQSGKALLVCSDGRRFEGAEAEDELQSLLGVSSGPRGGEPGIWGTLWVRQRHSFGGPDLDDAGRRTLRGCLESQVGAVTGGERGHKIPEAVARALGEIMSPRGPKGRLKALIEDRDGIGARLDDLQAKRDLLFDQMDELSGLQRNLKRMEADWDDDAHALELESERTKQTEAARIAAEIEAARSASRAADDRAHRARSLEAERRQLVCRLAEQDAIVHGLGQESAKADRAKLEAQTALDDTAQQVGQLQEKSRQVGSRVRRLDRIRAAASTKAALDQGEAVIERAARLEESAVELSAAIGRIAATEEVVARIESAVSEHSAAASAMDAVATMVAFDIKNPSAIRIDGAPLGERRCTKSVLATTNIEIDAVGSISIEARVKNREAVQARLRQAEEEILAALAAAGAPDLASARAALMQRRELERRHGEARRDITALAPGDRSTKLAPGLDALKGRTAELRGRLEAELKALDIANLPTLADIDRAICDTHAEAEIIASAISAAETALDVKKTALQEHDRLLRDVETRLAGARALLETKRAELAAGRESQSDEELAAEVTELAGRSAELRTALGEFERKRLDAPEAIAARIRRLEAAGRSRREETARLNTAIARLSTHIEVAEGVGLEETIELTRAELNRLETAVVRLEEEAAALGLLLDTLRQAESEAKAKYLAPVTSRVEPYLRMLLPGADVVLDENLGITALRRDGRDEEFERLSDGTQEQIAVLTRLAFAELLLEQGRPAAVILDDALAFSDDERMERMFDILSRAGERVQIIVLTCRKRLFARLGAGTLQLVEDLSATV